MARYCLVSILLTQIIFSQHIHPTIKKRQTRAQEEQNRFRIFLLGQLVKNKVRVLQSNLLLIALFSLSCHHGLFSFSFCFFSFGPSVDRFSIRGGVHTPIRLALLQSVRRRFSPRSLFGFCLLRIRSGSGMPLSNASRHCRDARLCPK